MPEVAEIKIALADVTPEIWRRVVVPAATSLAGLHTVIQAAMGWEDSHLHMFMVNGHRYGIPTGVRFKFVDRVHDIDSIRFLTSSGVLDTKGDQCHAAPE